MVSAVDVFLDADYFLHDVNALNILALSESAEYVLLKNVTLRGELHQLFAEN